jgi:hypothetical protein
MNGKPKTPNDREVWDRAIAVGKKEPTPELKDDRPAIRAALRASREKRGVRIKTHLI